MVIIFIILLLLLIGGLSAGQAWAWFVLIALAIWLIVAIVKGITNRREQRIQDEIDADDFAILKEKYDKWICSIKIPATAKECGYEGEGEFGLPFIKAEYQVYSDDIALHFVLKQPNIQNFRQYKNALNIIKLPIEKIEYFAIEGEVYRETKITGGGGGGVSVGGAIVGGLVGGNVGAVIGGRKSVDPVSSELITHDTRKTFINYQASEFDNFALLFTHDSYKSFEALIPNKAYDIVAAVRANNLIKQQVEENDDLTQRMEKLNKLRDNNLITNEEYQSKREEILNSL